MIKENYKSCFFFLKEKIFQILILSFVIFFSATMYGIYFSYQTEIEKVIKNDFEKALQELILIEEDS